MSEQGSQNMDLLVPEEHGLQIPQKIDARYSRNREIMLRFLENQSIGDIARIVGLTENTVRNILNSPLVKQEIERLSRLHSNSVVERIKGLADEAVTTIRDTMRGDVLRVGEVTLGGSELRFKAAKELLDRNPELNKKSDNEFAQGVGEEVIRQIARRLAERKANGTIEVEPASASESEALGESAGNGNSDGDSPDHDSAEKPISD